VLLLLRRIRYGLLGESRFGRYLACALGEVILVAAGILIALKLEDLRQQQENNALLRSYLTALIEDLRVDIARTQSWLSRYDEKLEGLTIAKEYYFEETTSMDPVRLLRKISYGGVGSRGQLLAASPAYADLISTGNLSLFPNDAFKRDLMAYFVNKEFFTVYADSLRTGYANYVNATYPWNAAMPDALDPRDMARGAQGLQNSQYIGSSFVLPAGKRSSS